MPTPTTPESVRCFCSAKVQIAQIERDERGRPRLRIKAIKRGDTIIDVICVEGVVKVMCRSCKRWHRFSIRRQTLDMDMSLYVEVFPRESE